MKRFPKSPGRTQKRITLPSIDTTNWRNPNMPVMRDYTMAGGTKRTTIDPDYERRYREHLIETDTTHPSYNNDPTYDLKKQRKKL